METGDGPFRILGYFWVYPQPPLTFQGPKTGVPGKVDELPSLLFSLSSDTVTPSKESLHRFFSSKFFPVLFGSRTPKKGTG